MGRKILTSHQCQARGDRSSYTKVFLPRAWHYLEKRANNSLTLHQSSSDTSRLRWEGVRKFEVPGYKFQVVNLEPGLET